MKIKRLFENLTDEELQECLDEISLLQISRQVAKQTTPLCDCFYLTIYGDKLYDLASIRLINIIKRNADYITLMGWQFETVREKDLLRIRGIGREAVAEFMHLRELYFKSKAEVM